MDRRTFLRTTVISAGAAALSGSLWREAMAAPAQPGPSPYGDLLAPDARGIQLPGGFVSRVVARSGRQVGRTSYAWHPAPDGGACFPDGDGWVYVSNSEVASTGGAGAIRFRGDGRTADAYRILDGTNRNCAGGATPWGTWLSCEEVPRARVFETDPYGHSAAVERPAMGLFRHEAAAVDPDRQVVYLTEDEPDGCLYRFRPQTWPSLDSGTLEAMLQWDGTGAVGWVPVPDPGAVSLATRRQLTGVQRFDGGEGAWYADHCCWFTTKGDNRVWRYDAEQDRLDIAYDDDVAGAPLHGVDNITGSRSGDLFVAEDRGDMESCVITPDDVVAAFLRVTGQDRSEITGPAFSPDGARLYFSSQRGKTGYNGGGITYEVRGPFRDST